jgi:hypothetical protein
LLQSLTRSPVQFVLILQYTVPVVYATVTVVLSGFPHGLVADSKLEKSSVSLICIVNVSQLPAARVHVIENVLGADDKVNESNVGASQANVVVVVVVVGGCVVVLVVVDVVVLVVDVDVLVLVLVLVDVLVVVTPAQVPVNVEAPTLFIL